MLFSIRDSHESCSSTVTQSNQFYLISCIEAVLSFFCSHDVTSLAGSIRCAWERRFKTCVFICGICWVNERKEKERRNNRRIKRLKEQNTEKKKKNASCVIVCERSLFFSMDVVSRFYPLKDTWKCFININFSVSFYFQLILVLSDYFLLFKIKFYLSSLVWD